MKNFKNELKRPALIMQRAKELKKDNSELTQQEAGQLAIEQLVAEGKITCIEKLNEQN